MKNHISETHALSIKEAARLSGLSRHTLRYYEKIGLIASIGRNDSSGHRRYTDSDISILQALAYLKTCGLKIEDMRKYLVYHSNRTEYAQQAKELFVQHEKVIAKQIQALKLQHQYVQGKIAYWEACIEGNEQKIKESIERNQKIAEQLLSIS